MVVKIKESIDANTIALKGITQDVDNLQVYVVMLQKENTALHEPCAQHKIYNWKWLLCLNRGEVTKIFI